MGVWPAVPLSDGEGRRAFAPEETNMKTIPHIVLALAAFMLAGCTRILIAGENVPAPKIDAAQLGGQLTVTDAGTTIRINNEKSFDDGAKTVRRLVSTLAAYATAAEWLDTKRAEDAAAASLEKAKVAADTQQQAQAAAAELNLLKETNRAAEAMATIPPAP